jgi:hypothetical protein
MRSKTDVLIFVEDPGAANYVAHLPAALAERGWQALLLADGGVKEYLLERGVRPTMVRPSMTAENILASFNPRLLLVGTSENPDTLGLALVAQARQSDIESVGVVDFINNADHRFRGRSEEALTYAPDWLLVPDEWTKDAYVELGYPAHRILVCGHPHYDHVLDVKTQLSQEDRTILRRRVLPQVPKGRLVVVFAAERLPGLDPQQYRRSAEYTLTGWGTSTGRTEIVLEEFLDAIQLVKPRPYLVLRLHPKNTRDEFTAYLDEFDLVSHGGSPLELVYVADLVVGMTSMLMLEAALLGRPTLSVVPRVVEMEWLLSIRIGITACVTTREQLRSNLANLLRDSSQMLRVDDGKVIVFGSLQRTAKFIERLLDGQERRELVAEKAVRRLF